MGAYNTVPKWVSDTGYKKASGIDLFGAPFCSPDNDLLCGGSFFQDVDALLQFRDGCC